MAADDQSVTPGISPGGNPPATLTNRFIAGRYDVLEPLGAGVLIASYRARDRSLNRIVTLKTPLPDFADREDVRARLRDGLGRILGLSQSGIVRTYDVGEDAATGNLFYIVEEFIRGIDLKERIRRAAPFQLAAANDVAIAIAEALEYAEARGVSHGDVRPQNVLVGAGAPGSEGGGIKLTGFGLSSAQSLAVGNAPDLRRIVPYRAPEVSRDSAATPAADVYALGVVLYELLTAELPYGGDNAFEIAVRHADAPLPSASAVNGNVPPALDGIIRTAMSKRPDERYASPTELLKDLRAVRDGLRYGKALTWTPTPRVAPTPVAIPSLSLKPEPIAPVPAAPLPALPAPIVLAPLPSAPVGIPNVSAVSTEPIALPESTVVPTAPVVAPTAAPMGESAPERVPERAMAEPAMREPIAPEPAKYDPYRNSSTGAPSRRNADPYQNTATGSAATDKISSRAVVPAPQAERRSATAQFAPAVGNPFSSKTGDRRPVDNSMDNPPNRSATPRPPKEEAPVNRGNPREEREEEERGGGNRYLTSINLALSLLVVLAIGFLIYEAANFLKPAEDVVVPNLVGKTIGDAKTVAGEQKFELAVVDEQFRDNDPVDTIYQMQPAAGRHIREGKQVEIWVSKGPHQVPVPDLTNKAAEDACQILIANNLRLGNRTNEYDPFTAKGDIIRQTPPGDGMAPRGGKVDIVVSKGEQPNSGSDQTPDPNASGDTGSPSETPKPSPSADDSDSSSKPRSFNMRFTLPHDNATHHIRIDVIDRDGTRTVFDETHKAGDKIFHSIQAVGKEIHIRVFDNDRLSQEVTK